MTETTSKTERSADTVAASTLRVVQQVEACEGRWLADAEPSAERDLTTDYLAGMGAYLRFARALYIDRVLEADHLRTLRSAASRVVSYADERLDMLTDG